MIEQIVKEIDRLTDFMLMYRDKELSDQSIKKKTDLLIDLQFLIPH